MRLLNSYLTEAAVSLPVTTYGKKTSLSRFGHVIPRTSNTDCNISKTGVEDKKSISNLRPIR